jgi:hypothetical protein
MDGWASVDPTGRTDGLVMTSHWRPAWGRVHGRASFRAHRGMNEQSQDQDIPVEDRPKPLREQGSHAQLA